MQKRISHSKSRKGCVNCKKRHVKCDEQGPPCANCISREITSTCTYGTAPPAPSQEVATRNTSLSPSQAPSSSTSASLTPPSTDATSVTSSNHGSESRRLLELELMNRWSYSTYKSLLSVSGDDHYLQVEVPRAALKHDFLLDGILSTSALEIAMSGEETDPAPYIYAALEYYDRGSTSFRANLSNVTKEKHFSMYIFSSLAAAINFALPQCVRDSEGGKSSALTSVLGLFELMIGTGVLGWQNWEALMESPLKGSIDTAMAAMTIQQTEPLGDDILLAFERLGAVVDGLEGNAEACKAYRTAVSMLHFCFVEASKGLIRCFFIAFPVMVGQAFNIALKNEEPVALFILMHFGVLLDNESDDRWWAKGVGRSLVLEISDALLLLQTRFSGTPASQDGIIWARQKVGLPALS